MNPISLQSYMLCKSHTDQDALQSMPVLVACVRVTERRGVLFHTKKCSKVAGLIHIISWRKCLKGGISFYAAVLLIATSSHKCCMFSNVIHIFARAKPLEVAEVLTIIMVLAYSILRKV